MTLLYLALGYFAGILAGYLLWQAGVLGCDLPPWLWLLPLAGLPFTIGWERRVPDPVDQPMRWPASAGFVPPTSALSAALVVTLGLAFTSGLLRYASQPLAPCPAPSQLAFYNATSPAAADPVTLIGYVNGYPQVQGDRQYLVVRAQAVHSNADSYAVDGLVRVKTTPSPRPVYGQPVRITGILQLPPVFEDFDYREYLAGQGVHSVMDWPRVEMLPGPRQGHPLLRGIYRVRSQGETLLKRLMPEPHAALANGMLLGIESGIPNDLYAAFNRTGASHTIVISGSNVALLSGVILAAGVRLLGRRRALWPTLAGIVFYALLVGGDASVTRAALMGGLFVTATTIGRQSTALVSLGAACWTMTLLNPLALWDVGFQLSAAATAGLILFSPVFTSTLDRLWPGLGQGGYVTGNLAATGQNLVRGLVTDGLLMTLAATLTSMPLLLFHFNRISLVSLVTNLLIAPVQPFILLWGSAGLLVGLAGLVFLAQIVLWVPYLCLVWTVAMVNWTDSWPGGSLAIAGYGLGSLVVTYLLVVIFLGRTLARQQGQRMFRWIATVYSRRFKVQWPKPPSVSGQVRRSQLTTEGQATASPRRIEVGNWIRNGRIGNTALGVLAVAGLLIWWMVLTQPDGYLHVHFLDVGQGDAIYVQTPGGRQILIDGGSDSTRLFSELGAVMPFWDRSLDLLVLTHPDRDHMGAQLALPQRFRIDRAVVSAVTVDDADGEPWEDVVRAAGVPLAIQGQGGWIDMGDGVALWSLWPPNEVAGRQQGEEKNERSLVQMLVYGDLRVLLTGDAGLPAESTLVRNGAPLSAQVLKVGHHGSHSSTGTDFVRAVDPLVAVIQVGENRYGHPHPQVLDELAGRLILRNDEHGRVHVWSDGRHMWIETEEGDLLRS